MSRPGYLVPLLALAVLLPALPAAAAEREQRLAALTSGDADSRLVPALPRGLPAADLARYREIFALQRQGQWGEAEALIGTLVDRVLLGHVLAERYLGRGSPRASYAELAGWLDRYADLPQAPRVHKLALGRKPAGAAPPRAPAPVAATGAREAWQQGLADWRAGAWAAAADRFTRLAAEPRLDEPERARAAFWAARANLRARRPHVVVPQLRIAAESGDGFYGPLGQRLLEDTLALERIELRGARGVLDLVLRYPATRRVLALAAIGERELADAELQRLALLAPSDQLHDLGAIAGWLQLPSARPVASARGQARRSPSRLPVAAWRPAGGYRLDPHLIHAVIRAESGFDPAARSPKGALGLMQIMPETGRLVAARLQVADAGGAWLLDPATNMAVGQAWLRQLAATPTVQGSLIHALVAYNGGEGRLRQWLAGALAAAADDPLLFVESVPIGETRAYVKKVLASLWAYQAEAGAEIPSLHALAESRWPELEPAPAPPPVPKAKRDARLVADARPD